MKEGAPLLLTRHTTLNGNKHPEKSTTPLPSFRSLSKRDSQPSKNILSKTKLLSKRNYFAIESGSFPIKFSMLPTQGAPWPHPAIYRPEHHVNAVDLANLRFITQGESCDVLEFAFHRFRVNLFGQSGFDKQYNAQILNLKYSNWTWIRTVNVTVITKCTPYPSLESREMCE